MQRDPRVRLIHIGLGTAIAQMQADNRRAVTKVLAWVSRGGGVP